MDQNSLLGSRIVGQLADPDRSVNVDTPEDFARAERLLNTLRGSPPLCDDSSGGESMLPAVVRSRH
jgi:hypothetical protein